jgi:hypothetical protein
LICLERRLKLELPATEDDLLRQVQNAKKDFRGKPQVTSVTLAASAYTAVGTLFFCPLVDFVEGGSPAAFR